ncbi:hypothetical protein BMW23_0785 [Bodo saltans virus]|uniref:MSV199 domain-containing protein n=1 Tax=Bodo saltans virus TaxID=2024608 RepID=A0A2H4UV82_9VIRU|nr:hypothetical protein QJ851_gp0768 [Bodo saltans virus]ATZ80831.1 hypothetical protein BMW23_0785 [Bodo saltans virus]
MAEKFDIVKMIEKNPITRLSKNYENKLITKIKTHFTNDEQQLFVVSFYCYLNYSKDTFVIDFNDVWKWIGFTRKDNAKRLLIKLFVENIDYRISLLSTEERTYNDEKGRQNKEQILMTVNAFKKFCLKADTKKADEIHNYYIKLEEMLHETINEETSELREQLSSKNKETSELREQLSSKNKEIKENNIKHLINLKMIKHNTLINLLKTKDCVYLAEIIDIEKKVQDETDDRKIKIGSSGKIDMRANSLAKEYGDCIFLDVFESEHFRETEQNILIDKNVVKNLYKNPIKKNGSYSKEVVQLSNDFTYEQLLSIVKKNVDNSQAYFFSPEQILEKQRIELENKKIDLESKKMEREHELRLLIINNNTDKSKVEKILNDVDVLVEKPKTKICKSNNNIIPDTNVKQTNNENCWKIQKINPNDLKEIVNVYDSMICVLRDPEHKGFNKTGIKNAIKTNAIYKEFRWNYIDNDSDSNIVNVKPTQTFSTRLTGSVIKLNSTKTEILDSFGTLYSAAKNEGMISQTLSRIINNNEKYGDYYYTMYSQCPKELLDKYDKTINKSHRQSKLIRQINPITKQFVIFNSLDEISIKLGHKHDTVKNAIHDKVLLDGMYWEYYDKNSPIPDDTILQNLKIKEIKTNGRKILKIDPNDLTKIIKVYDTMIHLLRDSDNKDCNNDGIINANKENTIYKNFRWKIIEKDSDLAVVKAESTAQSKKLYHNEQFVHLNHNKTKILDFFNTRKEIMQKFKITERKLMGIIEQKTKYNNSYFVKKSDCPMELLNKYQELINAKTRARNGTRIKRINVISNEQTIFNSWNELKIKSGHSQKK